MDLEKREREVAHPGRWKVAYGCFKMFQDASSIITKTSWAAPEEAETQSGGLCNLKKGQWAASDAPLSLSLWVATQRILPQTIDVAQLSYCKQTNSAKTYHLTGYLQHSAFSCILNLFFLQQVLSLHRCSGASCKASGREFAPCKS